MLTKLIVIIILQIYTYIKLGFPGGSAVKNPPSMQETKGHRFNPWVGKIPWRRTWQPTPVFLPGDSQTKESVYSPWGGKELDTTEAT